MNDYTAKVERRKERLQGRAEQMREKSDSLYKAGREALDVIPLGQPILYDHYSAKSDRAYRGRAIGKIEKSFELDKQAKEVERRAEAVGTGGISSDDPEALQKLETKLQKQLEDHETMKRMNAEARKNGTETPCPAWMLSNSNGRIKATRQRIAELENKKDLVAREVVEKDFTMKEDLEDNRILFFFAGKPEEGVRQMLRSRGFKWSPTRGAWVRQLTRSARYSADMIIKILTPTI
jgi:hypothetical protein